MRKEHPVAENVQGERTDPAGRRPGTRGLIAALAVGAALVAVGVPAVLAGRHRSDPPPAAAAAVPTPTFVEGQAPSLPPWEQHPDASPAPRSVVGLKGMPNNDGCPVDVRRLLAALRDSDLAAPRELTGIDCSENYAAARSGRATVIFRYSDATDSWRAVGGGSAACADVPEAVRAHLLPCH